jgi:hypothetical protein
MSKADKDGGSDTPLPGMEHSCSEPPESSGQNQNFPESTFCDLNSAAPTDLTNEADLGLDFVIEDNWYITE